MSKLPQLLFVPLQDGDNGFSVTIDFAENMILWKHQRFPQTVGYTSCTEASTLLMAFREYLYGAPPASDSSMVDTIGLALAKEGYDFIRRPDLNVTEDIYTLTKNLNGVMIEVLVHNYPVDSGIPAPVFLFSVVGLLTKYAFLAYEKEAKNKNKETAKKRKPSGK